MAAGMDDGCVRFFTWTAAGGLQYSRTSQKVDGRVLAVAWHPNGSLVVGGSSKGSIHIWEAGTSTELQCIELGESWDIAILQLLVIIFSARELEGGLRCP